MVLTYTLNEQIVRMGLHIMSKGGCCVNGNEPLGSAKGREFIGQVSDCQLVKGAVLYTIS